MISLKHYLDQGVRQSTDDRAEESLDSAVLKAYRDGLAHIGECGESVCPGLAAELSRGLKRIIESLSEAPSADLVAASERGVRDLLRGWGRKVASHYDQKATEVRDLLLVMSRTAESLGNKDDRVARRIDNIAEQLRSVVSLDDVSRIRASVESSARELKSSLNTMTAEGKALIDHLRAEVSTYQTKLEKAERVASSDALTGLGSRHWVEGRIQERIGSGAPFSIVLIDILGFHQVVETYGNLVGDLLLKEFARELRSALGNGEYETTLASGSATIGVLGTSGLGSMQGGALEGSNVNISAEFSKLIIAQRAFEANSKAITTFDTVTQETINMIR